MSTFHLRRCITLDNFVLAGPRQTVMIAHIPWGDSFAHISQDSGEYYEVRNYCCPFAHAASFLAHCFSHACSEVLRRA